MGNEGCKSLVKVSHAVRHFEEPESLGERVLAYTET